MRKRFVRPPQGSGTTTAGAAAEVAHNREPKNFRLDGEVAIELTFAHYFRLGSGEVQTD
jgi:hypothetical protein